MTIMSVKKRLRHLGHMTRPEPTLPVHEPTLPIHEPLMNHPVPLLTLRVIRSGGIEPKTFLGTALRQAYDYWQDQPGFANPRGDLGPRFGTRAHGDMAWALVSGATFPRCLGGLTC